MSKNHWENVYQTKSSNSVSWFQENPSTSLSLIEKYGDKANALIDVGAGASLLVDFLLKETQLELHVLDLSESALNISKQRLGTDKEQVNWLVGDVTDPHLDLPAVEIWHDRAVFHFLNEEAQRNSYIELLNRTLKPNGILILSTFAADGPEKCSGLPVQRYSTENLAALFEPDFKLLNAHLESHQTPFDTEQSFAYIVMKKTKD